MSVLRFCLASGMKKKKKTIRVLVHDQLIKIEVTGFMKVFLETDNC